MASKDPFSGLRLSEQASTGKLEQRLFTSEPSPPVPARKPAGQIKGEEKTAAVKSVEAAVPPATASVSSPAPKALPKSSAAFDLTEEPLYQASFLFTERELESLEDLKLELRREYDTKVTKNALIRSALHMLLEDHAANGVGSYATKKIRTR